MKSILNLLLILALVAAPQLMAENKHTSAREFKVEVPLETRGYWRTWVSERLEAEDDWRKMAELTARIEEAVSQFEVANKKKDDRLMAKLIEVVADSETQYGLRMVQLYGSILDADKKSQKNFYELATEGTGDQLRRSAERLLAEKQVYQAWEKMLFDLPVATVAKEKWEKLVAADPSLKKPSFIHLR